ncbi:MAG: hypothetical protein O7F76_00180, partial [Planctomycetota bacterium]|nr:hypothetical protein [Planctomycetota bacterium]
DAARGAIFVHVPRHGSSDGSGVSNQRPPSGRRLADPAFSKRIVPVEKSAKTLPITVSEPADPPLVFDLLTTTPPNRN